MKAFALVGMLAALGLAGCTDGNSITYEVPPMDDDGNYVIEMGPGTNQLGFRPRYAEVPVGATVVWKNMGGIHNAVSGEDGKDAGVWPAPTATDGNFVLSITSAMLGEQPYFCTPHWSLGMTGGLKVVEPSDAMAPA